jgi:GNAT superfamily N-acetyltransferase
MIRRAVAAEAEVVRAVVLAAYERYVGVIGTQPGPMLDDYAARIAQDQVWVLEEAAGIAGVLVLEEGPDGFLLDNVTVAPEWQGRGLGRTLLDFAEAEARGRGRDAVTLYTNALMTENIALYRARGYVERKRRREKGLTGCIWSSGWGDFTGAGQRRQCRVAIPGHERADLADPASGLRWLAENTAAAYAANTTLP